MTERMERDCEYVCDKVDSIPIKYITVHKIYEDTYNVVSFRVTRTKCYEKPY